MIFKYSGQKYYADNRLGLSSSTFYGFLCLLSEPKGLVKIMHTKHSETNESARKRYISTILHFRTWFTGDLQKGSE